MVASLTGSNKAYRRESNFYEALLHIQKKETITLHTKLRNKNIATSINLPKV